MISKVWLGLFLVLAFSTCVVGQDLAGVKCVVNGEKQATADAAFEYQDGKVYFCCQNCLAKFKEDMKKDAPGYATKANHQLVLTGQYVQKGCPMSGDAIDEELMLEVGGAKVGFCCKACHDKVDAAEGLAAKAELVFASAPFAKAFHHAPAYSLEGVKCMMMPEEDVSDEFCADYEGHKVFFCCKKCLGKFSKDPATYAAKANQQLVATGQVAQVACPISGKAFVDDQTSEVAGVSVKYCCDKCKGKVEAADEKARLELVFGIDGFKKGFTADKE